MKYNVAQLLKEPVGSTRRYEVTPEEGVDVRGHVDLLRTDRSILVKSQLSTRIKTECSRCLCSFNTAFTIRLEDEFYPTLDVVLGVPVPPPQDPDAFTIDSQHVLDITEAIRQYVVLALPMKPLCKPDCQGLCPQCGRNLNEGQCSCPQKSVDPRWTKLQELLKTTSQQEEVPRRRKTARRSQ